MVIKMLPPELNSRKMSQRQRIAKFSAHLIVNERIELLERRLLGSLYPERLVKDSQEKRPRLRGAACSFHFDLQICQVPFVVGPNTKRDLLPPSATPTRTLECKTFPFLIKCLRNLSDF